MYGIVWPHTTSSSHPCSHSDIFVSTTCFFCGMLEPFAAALELDRLPATGRCPQHGPRRPREPPCDPVGRIGRCSAVIMAASLAYTKGRKPCKGQRGRTGLVGLQSFLAAAAVLDGGLMFVCWLFVTPIPFFSR